MNRVSNLIGDAWASKCSCHNGTEGQRVNPDLLLILFVIILLAMRTKDLKKNRTRRHNENTTNKNKK